jgi:hypothetical protein
VIGEGKSADGTVIRRRARGPGMNVDVTGATDQGVVDRQRSVTASWLGLDLPAALSDPGPATIEVKQTGVKQLPEGARFEFAYSWHAKTMPAKTNVNVDVVGARDIRITDMKSSGEGGTFIVNTTKATDPARYDLVVSGRIGETNIVSRAIPFEVTEGASK